MQTMEHSGSFSVKPSLDRIELTLSNFYNLDFLEAVSFSDSEDCGKLVHRETGESVEFLIMYHSECVVPWYLYSVRL